MIEKNTYGTAIDLGTTTIACYLWDITGKRLLGKNSRMNPQAVFGADIVSRMVYCEKSPGNFNRLREKTAGEISGMIFDLCKNAGIDSSEIKKSSCSRKYCYVSYLCGMQHSRAVESAV